MTWYALDSWIVVVGALCAVACALPGCFLQLRKMSMMGDALSHAVLPGLALGFLLTGSRDSLPMFIGAASAGVLTAVFVQWISQWGKVDQGASMGIVFTTLFALGLILIVNAADQVDLDPSCVLYGAIELTPLDTVTLLSTSAWELSVPRAARTLSLLCLINLALILVFYKELKLTSFDPDLANALGIPSAYLHYLLMAMVAVTTVAAFEAVGSILVIAMLIVPSATALLLTRKLNHMLWISAIIAGVGAGFGHVFALILPPALGYSSTSTSGMMAVTLGFLFALAWLFSPEHGLLLRWMRKCKSTPRSTSQGR